MNRVISPLILEAVDLKVIKGGALLVDLPRLELPGGEVLSLIGPNGAGKTTLMQALAFLTKPTAGSILFKGQRVEGAQAALAYRRRIAMVFQEPLLFNATVSENVAAGLKFRKLDRSRIRKIVESQLERFGIARLRKRSTRTLSGGEAQRTSLARAFATEPEILFLDEPFASLDPPTREALTDDLETALRATGTTAVLATHDRTEALRLSDRIGIMNRGKMIQIGPPDEVMNRPADEFTAAFVGAETIVPGRVTESNGGSFLAAVEPTTAGAAACAGNVIEAVGEARVGEHVVFSIRPENITLSLRAEESSARNQFRGKIERIVPVGFFFKVQIECGFPLSAFITRRSLDELSLSEGTEVYASFKATAIHVVKRGR